MPAKLTLYPAERPSRFVVVRDGESLTVGRAPDCGLVIEDPKVSKHHTRLVWDGAGWTLQDLGSKNGTSVDGVPVADRRLRGGEWLSFGGLLAAFDRISAEEANALSGARLARLQTGMELRRRLGAELEPFDLLLRFLESAIGITGADRGFVLLVGPGGRLHVEVSAGFEPGDARAEGFTGSLGAVQRTLQTGSSIVVSDAQRDRYLGARPSVVAMGLGVVVCVPLKHADRVIGLIYVDSPRPGAELTELDLEILEALAEHTAIVIGGLQLERSIARLAARPPGASASLDELQQRLSALAVPAPGPAAEPPAS
jgi:hypothetical protein